MDSSKAVVFTWSLRLDELGVLRTLWQTPVDVQRDRGFIIDAGDGNPRPVNFTSCDAEGCYVAGILAPEFLVALEDAPTITAAYLSSSSGKPVRVSLSSLGLKDVLLMLREPDGAAR